MTTTAAYHRLAVHPRQRWWKPVLATAALIVVAMIVQMILYAVVYLGALIVQRPADLAQAPDLSGYLDIGLGLASIAIALPLVLLAARYMQSRPAGSVSSVLGRLRRGWLGQCLALATLTTGPMIAGSVGLMTFTGDPDAGLTEGGQWVGAGTFVGGLAMLLVLVPVQAAAEEYLFRGWLLQAIGAFARSPWPAIAVQAVLFAALHGWGTPWGFADLVAFGVVLGWLTVRTGGLEAAIALHVMNNLILMVLAATDGSLTLDETAADMPWQGMVVDTLTVLAYAAAVTWLARRRNVASRAPVGMDGSTAADPGDEAVQQIGDGVVGEVAAAHADG
jgi:membrane protease YdiL (CAAX protease family)